MDVHPDVLPLSPGRDSTFDRNTKEPRSASCFCSASQGLTGKDLQVTGKFHDSILHWPDGDGPSPARSCTALMVSSESVLATFWYLPIGVLPSDEIGVNFVCRLVAIHWPIVAVKRAVAHPETFLPPIFRSSGHSTVSTRLSATKSTPFPYPHLCSHHQSSHHWMVGTYPQVQKVRHGLARGAGFCLTRATREGLIRDLFPFHIPTRIVLLLPPVSVGEACSAR